MRNCFLFGFTMAAALVAFCFGAVAENGPTADDFYRGKQISLVVNYTAGGPTDTEARLLAQHLPDHIPGHPSIVVRNMPGAGGLIGVNWLGKVAVPDGLTMGYFTGLAAVAAEGDQGLNVDPTALPFVAGVEALEVYYARSDLGGGLHTPADLLKKRGFWVGGLTPDSAKDIQLRAELDLLGLSYHYISGYPGAAEARLALQQNEIQLTSESLPTYMTSIQPALIKTGTAIPLWYDTSANYSETGDPDAAGLGVPPFEAFYKKFKGPPPNNDLWRINQVMKETSTALLRTIHFPPGAPAVALQIMQRAVADTQRDPAYRADALKTIKYVPRFSIGPAAEATYRSVVSVDPKTQKLIEDFVAKGIASVGK
jgi:hypothetical protein